MDASNNARIEAIPSQCIRDAYLLGRTLNPDQPFGIRLNAIAAFGNIGPEATARLAQAISDGDLSVTGALLRGWGVR